MKEIEYLKPENFDKNNQEFDIFNDVSQEAINSKISNFKNVRVSTNSVIFKYFKVFRENCIHDGAHKQYSTGYKFYLKYIFPHFNFSKKRFILFSNEWDTNYYHWNILALTNLLKATENNLIKGSILLLPKKYQKSKFIITSLKKFGITEDQIFFLRKKSNVRIKNLFQISARHGPEDLNQIRKILTSESKNTKLNFGNKIYISREDQKCRFVENEKELTQLLQNYGFKKILVDKFSYEEQISICNNASYIVSPHGAGLTNILFMEKSSSVLEIAGKPDAHKLVTDYYRMANMLGLKYFYQECKFGPNSPVKDFHQGSLIVDLEKLEKNLKLMLK